MSSAKPVLYSYWRSSCAWRVRIALALKGVDYEYQATHLVKDGGEQNTKEYAKLNPMQQVPTLLVNGCQLTQSMAIIEYLNETYSSPPLLPKDPLQRAKVRAISEMINSGIQPIQNHSVLVKLAEFSDDSKKSPWAYYWIKKGFDAVESTLQDTAGRFCVGDEITIADLYLVPQVYNAERFKVDLSAYPTIRRIHETLTKMPEFQAADPSVQPDCPEKQ